MKKIIISLFIFLFLSGCTLKEPEQSANVFSLIFDRKNGNFICTAEVLLSNEEETKIITKNAENIFLAISVLENSLPNKCEFSHLSVIMFGKNLIKTDIDNIFIFLLNENQIPLSTKIISTIDSEAITSNLKNENTILGIEIDKFLSNKNMYPSLYKIAANRIETNQFSLPIIYSEKNIFYFFGETVYENDAIKRS